MKLRNLVVPRIGLPRGTGPTIAAVVVVVVVVCVSLLAHAATKPGVVKTRSGQTFEGDVEQLPDGSLVITAKSGVVSRVARDDIVSFEEQGKSFLEQFNQRRAKLDPSDVKGRLDLARFALDHKQYQLALLMVEEATEIAPNNEEARTLRETIRQQARLDRQQRPPATTPASPPGPATAPATEPTATTTPAGGPHPGERRFLTADDIQQVRRGELKSGDSTRVAIPNDVRRAYATQAGVSFAQFSAKPPVEQAIEILSKGDDSMRKQVKITSDPEAIVRFKQIQPIVLSGCATTSCHGTAGGGGLTLYPADNDAATYTNFYILSKFARNAQSGNGANGGNNNGGGGFFGGGGSAERKLIERGRGDQSLLVQYGLPEAKATYKHPKVANFRPAFRDRDDPMARRVIGWMNDVLKPIEPTYDINYPLPGKPMSSSAPAATQPSKPE